jgi:uncharacterized SAM-binding protein YcdF (DUF218 family)
MKEKLSLLGHHRRRISRILIAMLAGIGVVHTLAVVTPVLRWWATSLAGPWEDPQGEVIIVPGAEANTDTIGVSSYWRTVYAYRAWRKGGVRTIVVSGGGEIAHHMKEFLRGCGVPESAIVVEDRSTSTRENALFSKALVDALPGRKILMTSDFHCRRATATFRKAGIDVAPHPIPDALKRYGKWPERWAILLTLTVETAKLGYYRWKDWT